MSDFLIDLDTSVFLWLNSFYHPFWDVFMLMASGRLTWIGLYVALLLAIWRAYDWRTLIVITLAAAITVALADQITASVFRPYVERLRPANPDNPISALVHIVDEYRGGRYGFPSCHAANTFAVCTLLSLVFRRARFTAAMIVWALLNCYSRIYLGVHYPGDILAGTIIGCLVGTLMYAASYLIISHWKGAAPTGRTDRLRHADINGHKFSYRAIDIPIAAEALTILYLLCFAA